MGNKHTTGQVRAAVAAMIETGIEALEALTACADELERAARALGGRNESPLVAGCLIDRALHARSVIAKVEALAAARRTEAKS